MPQPRKREPSTTFQLGSELTERLYDEYCASCGSAPALILSGRKGGTFYCLDCLAEAFGAAPANTIGVSRR
jgi:hypothetical protein